MNELELKKVLALINKGRRALKLKPHRTLRKGVINDMINCPIVKGMEGVECDGSNIIFKDTETSQIVATTWRVKAKGKSVELPDLLMSFSIAHGMGWLPELEEKDE